MAKILLIDDDTVLLKLYSTRLLADKHQVETAIDGEDGLKKMATLHPDVIVLDLLMPKLNGFGFIDTLRQHPIYKNVAIIVFSSVANEEQISRLKDMGIKVYLNKIDTTPTQLVEAINTMLSNTAQPPS